MFAGGDVWGRGFGVQAEVTQRLSRASVQTAGGGLKAGNLPPQRTHEDLAKKLQVRGGCG